MTPLIQVKTIRNILHENEELLFKEVGSQYIEFDFALFNLKTKLEKEQRNLQPELPLDCNNE